MNVMGKLLGVNPALLNFAGPMLQMGSGLGGLVSQMEIVESLFPKKAKKPLISILKTSNFFFFGTGNVVRHKYSKAEIAKSKININPQTNFSFPSPNDYLSLCFEGSRLGACFSIAPVVFPETHTTEPFLSSAHTPTHLRTHTHTHTRKLRNHP